MEDWMVIKGWAQCQTGAANRSIHSLTHQLNNLEGSFAMSVKVGPQEAGKKADGGAGFRLGVRSDLNEHRSNAFARGGIQAGLVGKNLVLGNKKKKVKTLGEGQEFALYLIGEAKERAFHLTLSATSLSSGKLLAVVSNVVSAKGLEGNIALVSNYKGAPKRTTQKGYRFSDWKVGGDAFKITEKNRFGPLLWSMYSLGDTRGDEGFVLKLSALTGPLGKKDNQEVELFLQRDGQWKSHGKAPLDPDAWVATFRLPKWNEKVETPYKLVYMEQHKDGSQTPSEWSGKIKANPEGRALRLGALTCQNDYAFPYEPVANNLVKLDPDMLYFSGDQLYENHGGFGIIRDPADPAILNYLRKFYQFGWSFREAMKDRPTLCLPDDHDVFQGNIWGEGGAKMKNQSGGASSKGGYREPAKMVNVVHRTNTAHHPDPLKALHINGDQHLTTLSQYGVDQQRDSNWFFCTPAIAAGYPRWWRPDEVGMPHQNRPKANRENTGEYIDGCGNKVYVYAVGNPIVPTEKNRYKKAHQKGSGFGLVTIDSEKKTYVLDSFRFLVDASDGKADNQFPSWPVTIEQKENGGDNMLS